jgi:hypothetical protein
MWRLGNVTVGNLAGTQSGAATQRGSWAPRRSWYVLIVNTACPHVANVIDVAAGLEVCESCMERGGVWKTLRQCLMCGRTDCCDSSPNRHATAHFNETGHEIVRTLEPGQDWAWCYACEKTIRRGVDATWSDVDPFYEAGFSFARRLAAETGGLDVGPDETTPEGFPLGTWVATYRDRRRDGTLDPEQATNLEALPGWTW